MRAKFWIVIAVLTMLLGGAGGYYIYSSQSNEIPEFLPVGDGAAWQNWQSIEVRQNNRTIQLRRGRNGWRIENYGDYPVADAVIAAWADHWTHTENRGLAAWGKSGIVESGVDDGDPRMIRLTVVGAKSKIIADWMLSKQANAGQYWARAARKDRVYNLQMPFDMPTDISGWLPDYFSALRADDMAAIWLRVGEANVVDLRRNADDLQSWRIANLPPGKMLRPDSAIVKLPKFWQTMTIESIQPIDRIRPGKSDRVRAEFYAAHGLRIIVTQAVDSNIIYSHFRAEPMTPAMAGIAGQWNQAFGKWVFVLDAASNALLRLDMPTIVQPAVNSSPSRAS